MPRLVPMSTLILRVQQLADMEGDPSIDAVTEVRAIISEQYGESYEIVAAAGNRYFEYTVTLVTDGTNYLPEPVDQLSQVDELELILDAASGRCRRLHRIKPQQRASMSGRIGSPRFFELVDGRYFLYPTPPANQQLTLRYVPQCPDLTGYADAGQVDCYCVAGQKFVQYAAAIEMIDKSKNDSSHLVPKLALQRELLTEWAAERAMNSQPVWYVEDVDGEDWLPSNWSW